MVDEPEDNPYVRDPDLDFQDPSGISRDEAEKQVEELREAIEYHNYRYYVENNPVISDSAYDVLFHRLEDLEAEFGLADENSPTMRVGGQPLDSFDTVEHVKEMLSLDSSENADDVRRFDERVKRELGDVEYSAEPKFDGLSVEIVYLEGEFDRAVMRGDGERGDDVSANVKTIGSVPLRLIDAPEVLSVRGEIYMPKSGFHRLNEERLTRGEEPFSNPRNAAAGTMRQLDPKIAADRPLEIFFYDVLESSREVETQFRTFKFLKSLGLRVNDLNRKVEDIESFIDYRDEIMDMRDDLEYGVDGVVGKVDDISKREEMGTTARHPRWAFAYKFPPKSGLTRIERIVVQVGRTGKLTPVALLDPVDIEGVTVSRATLHNAEVVEELGASEGAEVEVKRAGDVIPEIRKVLNSEDRFSMPGSCPICGSEVVREGKYHFCSGGISCPAQLIGSLQHFCSKTAMNIEGIGEKVARKLVEEGLVEALPDIYDLEKKDLVELDGFGDKSVDNLLEQIEGSRESTLDRFLYALGIRHVGRERARLLAERFSLEDLERADRKELEEVEDLGSEVSESVFSFFRNEKNLKTLKRLKGAMKKLKRPSTGDEFEGVKIVFTGKIEGYTRDELKDLMEGHGASVTSTVSNETDFLVKGDNPGSRKLESARELGTKILDVEEFKERFLENFG